MIAFMKFLQKLKCFGIGHEYNMQDYLTVEDGKFRPGYRLKCVECGKVKVY